MHIKLTFIQASYLESNCMSLLNNKNYKFTLLKWKILNNAWMLLVIVDKLIRTDHKKYTRSLGLIAIT